MTLKKELEVLRREPIEVFSGDPMDIPCIETSDAERLCKHPVVSVQMSTYNHEPYIRQAIDGVMMQKTDFEFELIIGEDCSQDKTREICFEYQRKYPDKIRVLWWHQNVSKLGGNGRRCRARCRGEFIALCEGDDYWTDPEKLQRQVAVMRRFPDVAFCTHRVVELENGRLKPWWAKAEVDCLFERKRKDADGVKFIRDEFLCPHLLSQTASFLVRKAAIEKDLPGEFRISIDWILCYVALSRAFGYFIDREMSVYRRTGQGAWTSLSAYGAAKRKVRWGLHFEQVDPTSTTRLYLAESEACLRRFTTPYKEMIWVGRKVAVGLRLLKRLFKRKG